MLCSRTPMHEVLFCSDLLGLICQNCDLHTLTQLSLTNRTISDEALHVLWSSIENFGPLIRCMPADLWEQRSSAPTPRIRPFLVRFSQPPTQKCRLTLFAPIPVVSPTNTGHGLRAVSPQSSSCQDIWTPFGDYHVSSRNRRSLGPLLRRGQEYQAAAPSPKARTQTLGPF